MLRRRRLALLLTAALIPLALGSAVAQQLPDEERLAADEAEAPPPEAAPYPDPGVYAPTITGLTGLFRTVSAGIGGQHTFRIALHTQSFISSDFLVRGDENTRFIGTLAGSYTPWKFVEVFANISSSANSNERPQGPDNLDLILALGDLSFGAKGQYPVLPYLAIGGNLGFTFLNSVGGVSFDAGSTSFYIGALSTFDLAPLADLPWRFHLNAGYQLDNSNNLASLQNQDLADLVVEKFALGLNPDRLQIKVATDFALDRWVGFGLSPIVELAADVATGDRDPDFDMERFSRPVGPLSADEFDGRTTLWMTMGVRARPVRGLNIDLAVDKGLLSPGYSYGSPVIPWNIIFGLSYAYDPNPPTRVVTKAVTKEVVKEVAPEGGKLRGRVINEGTLEPVEGAIVTFPGKDLTGLSTDPDGSFLTYELPGGKHALMVRHPDYEPAKLTAEIKSGAVISMEIKLVPGAGRGGILQGRIVDPKGNGVAATIAISGADNRQVTADASGAFSAELLPGTYNLAAMADGYLRKERTVALTQGARLSADFTLSPQPAQPLVKITKRALVIRRQVHFASGTATIMPDSQQLLDAIIHTMLTNPNIKKVEIGGHTDNRGSEALNQRLSLARANAVKEYLVQNGVSEDRLVTRGYGPSQPKVPNITPRNRAQNRRVEFLILEQ